MRRLGSRMVLVGVLVAGFVASARLTILAQDRRATAPARLPSDPMAKRAASPPATQPERGSLQDALLRPYDFPFREPTKLEDVAEHLRKTLAGRVVVDRAAVARQELSEVDTVQLDLQGVRLKVGLKLLLDQVGLTYKVVPEDNLLIITDLEGADDPLSLILTELRSIHRDLHDVQDSVDEIRETLGLEEDGEDPGMRKPAFIKTPRARSEPRKSAARRGTSPSPRKKSGA